MQLSIVKLNLVFSVPYDTSINPSVKSLNCALPLMKLQYSNVSVTSPLSGSVMSIPFHPACVPIFLKVIGSSYVPFASILPCSSTQKIGYGLYFTSDFSTPSSPPVPVPNNTVVPGSIINLHFTDGATTVLTEHIT